MNDLHKAQRYVPALGYHRLTPTYDVVVGATTRERTFKSALIEQVNLSGAEPVLDLVCCTGTLMLWIKPHYPHVDITGTDGEPNVLLLAVRKRLVAKLTLRLDHELSFALPYAEPSFDRVVSSLFFHHLSWLNKQGTARKLCRALRPGGELHIANWGKATGPVMRTAFLLVLLLDGFSTTKANVEGQLIELLRDAGFSDVAERDTFATILSTLSLYSAVKV